MNGTVKRAVLSLAVNLVCCAYHIVLGALTNSFWLLTVGIYYALLSTVRFGILTIKRNDRFAMKFTGGMLIVLSFPLAITVFLSVIGDRGHRFHMIVMIAIAAYAFAKITLATVKLVKIRRNSSAKLIALRNVSFASALVSIFALQRSMLVSFEGMTETEIQIMNAVIGSAVCVIVFLLGLNLLQNKRELFHKTTPT